MPSITHQARALQKEVRRIINKYGRDVLRVRPGLDGSSDSISTIKIVVSPIRLNEIYPFMPEGMFSTSNADAGQVMSAYNSDVLETDLLGYDAFYHRVGRISPLSLGNYIIAYIAQVQRETEIT